MKTLLLYSIEEIYSKINMNEKNKLRQKERNLFFCKVDEKEKIRAVKELKNMFPDFPFKDFDRYLELYIDTHKRCPSDINKLKQFIKVMKG